MGLMTTDEFAAEAKVSPRTAERWARQGVVPRVRVGRRWLIDAEQALTPEQPAEDAGAITFSELEPLMARIIDPGTAQQVVGKLRELAGGTR